VEGAVLAKAEAADLGQDQAPVLPVHPVAPLGVGEAVVPAGSLEAGIAGRLSALAPAEEVLEGAVLPLEHVLEHLRVDQRQERGGLLLGGEGSTLLGEA